MPVADVLSGLPPSLKSVAALALTGHSKREIAYLLDLPETALRQRFSALRRTLAARGIPLPATTPGLNLDLQYGRIRDALLPLLIAQRRHHCEPRSRRASFCRAAASQSRGQRQLRDANKGEPP